ncbi:hypothetical protein [Nostoc piscinale]|uniref:hypothetical protein n=1 Tax=Nostoc piscinale TaxID=224012 RepID=UPI000A90F835|nr:hypothetical protein [Nostoc piscinale]
MSIQDSLMSIRTPYLYNQLRKNIKLSSPTSSNTTIERVSNPFTQCRVCVFDNLEKISIDWVGLKSIVRVERVGTRAGKPYHETAYYISSLL